MKAPRPPVPVLLMVMVGALVLGISGCMFMPSSQPRGMRSLFLPPPRASVLVIITNPGSESAMRATGALVEGSARAGERIVILSAQTGGVLVSFQAPGSPTAQVPAPPVPVAPHSTSFQKARHAQAVQENEGIVRRVRAALQRREQETLEAWSRSVVAEIQVRAVLQDTEHVNISADLGAAVSDLSSLRQSGMGDDAAEVIAIIGIGGQAVPSAPTPPAGLESSTVVVDDFPGTTDEEAAWQASLVQGGAARAVLLTPAADGQLVPVVRQGLDGAVTDTLTSVLFDLGQYKLRAVAMPQLRHLLYLLTVAYPHATASINGYTDSLPVPGGNLLLSQRRAQAVEDWLVAHGVAAGRLQAFGYGDTDPVAPNASSGQPLNRRVVVVIDPAVSAPTT